MADHDLVLVTGAGGMGRLVTERLRAQNVPVRADPPRGRPRGRGAGMGRRGRHRGHLKRHDHRRGRLRARLGNR
ncbi:hypothetical protein [Streptomyces sp. ME19-01-6]|uniref:hypothetical protein n=1 Tax=Streptomyces sp. ME19-01-6 TaxID=3028686 RepID=UPI0029B5E385|nr:hypothetical protein [Streptomyces sp. ME19-01-6]MDX3233584.1 hypothetical protein [Streptomyces sp. ME19-01-6]